MKYPEYYGNRFLGTMRPIHRYAALPSTLTVAMRLAAAGAPAGACVVASEQTAGIGRHGHAWHSEPASGLYCSIILRPTETGPWLTLAIGLATAETLGYGCDLRWPNDVMLNGRKVAGILVEMHGSAIVAGIGINVNHAQFPEDIRALATSLRIETGFEHDREEVLQRLLTTVDDYAALPRDEIRRLFCARSTYARGKRVIVEDRIEGVTAGLDPQGFLIVRKADGSEETILAGGVRALSS